MSEKPSQGKAQVRRRNRRVAAAKAYMSLMAAIALMVMAFPIAIVALVCMVPTLVTYIVDLTPGRYAFRCVAALNFAGTAPFLRDLWAGSNTLAAAVRIIADSMTWLVSYGAAAFGWTLFFCVPSLVATVSLLNAKRRANALRERQGRLIREWGKSVAGENWRGFAEDVEFFTADDDDEDDAEPAPRPEPGRAPMEDEAAPA
jgi:hypothetical protein